MSDKTFFCPVAWRAALESTIHEESMYVVGPSVVFFFVFVIDLHNVFFLLKDIGKYFPLSLEMSSAVYF
jgi:hypothetical protein